MSSEDVLPTYEEAVKVHQTPWHIIEEETIHLTFDEPSATSKIKWFISRTESQHGVYTGPKRKNKIVVFVENMLTARTPKKFHMPSGALRDQEDLYNQDAHSQQHQKTLADGAEPSDT